MAVRSEHSVFLSHAQTVAHIAAVETGGDRQAALAELIAAAADGAIMGSGFCTRRASWGPRPWSSPGRIDIHRDYWARLQRGVGEVVDDGFETIDVSERRLHRPYNERTAFTAIEFPRADLERLWPPRHGPARGTVARYKATDEALYPEVVRLMGGDRLTCTAATRKLAEAGQVAGEGTPESRAKRLAKGYRAWQRDHPAAAKTD